MISSSASGFGPDESHGSCCDSTIRIWLILLVRACIRRTPCRSAVWAPSSRRRDATPMPLRRPDLQRLVRQHPRGPLRMDDSVQSHAGVWPSKGAGNRRIQGVSKGSRHMPKRIFPPRRSYIPPSCLRRQQTLESTGERGHIVNGVDRSMLRVGPTGEDTTVELLRANQAHRIAPRSLGCRVCLRSRSGDRSSTDGDWMRNTTEVARSGYESRCYQEHGECTPHWG